jgi:hypothetical protein
MDPSRLVWLVSLVFVSSVTGLGYVFLRQEAKPRSIRRVVKILYRLAFSSNRSAVIFENDADRQYFVQEGLVPEGAHLLD